MQAANEGGVLAPVVVLILELTAGILFNVFIVSVIFCDFTRQKSMSSSNEILASLGISNVSYGILISAGLMDEFVDLRASYTLVLSSVYNVLLLYSISSCGWLGAGLAVFYFIKISQARIVSWVKLHISSIVPWMLLVLKVMSLTSSFTCLLFISPQTSSWNVTDSPPSVLKVLAENRSGLINAALTVTAIPFTILLVSTTSTIWTLKQHRQKMERSMETVGNGRLTSYELVVERMTRILFFYVIIYTLMLIFYFSFIAQIKSGFWITLLLLSAFTPVHSVLLILGNPRLNGALKKMYQAFVGLHGSNEG